MLQAAEFKEDETGKIFSGSVGQGGAGSSGMGAPTTQVYDIRWNKDTASLEVMKTYGSAWSVLLKFEHFDV